MSFQVVNTASDGASSKRQCVGEKEDNNKLCFLLNHGDEWEEWEELEEKEEVIHHYNT